MSYFAKIENSIVTEVIAAEQDFIDSLPGTWVQTSYNTHGGIHYAPNVFPLSADGGVALRKNFAGVGFTYDQNLDAFIPPKPVQNKSWILNKETCLWEAPVPYPTDGKVYVWDETHFVWVEINPAGPTE